jgi:hypothetical protein
LIGAALEGTVGGAECGLLAQGSPLPFAAPIAAEAVAAGAEGATGGLGEASLSHAGVPSSSMSCHY